MTEELIETLLTLADSAMRSAIAPYSRYKVGAALLSSDGTFYTGCNIENPSLMMTVCAERVAVWKAVSESRIKEPNLMPVFKAIAIVSSNGEYCFPCGSCRQAMIEFAPDAMVYLKSKKGIRKFTVKELLPDAFGKGI